MKIKADTIARTICLALALLNQILATGKVQNAKMSKALGLPIGTTTLEAAQIYAAQGN